MLRGDLLVHIFSQVPDCRDIIIDFVEFACDENNSDLVQDHRHRVHEFGFKCLLTRLLAHLHVVWIDHLNGDMDGLSWLLKLDAHLVHSVDDAFTTLAKIHY